MMMRKLPGTVQNTSRQAHYYHKTPNQIPSDDIFQPIMPQD